VFSEYRSVPDGDPQFPNVARTLKLVRADIVTDHGRLWCRALSRIHCRHIARNVPTIDILPHMVGFSDFALQTFGPSGTNPHGGRRLDKAASLVAHSRLRGASRS
jgi:hypothetical protein